MTNSNNIEQKVESIMDIMKDQHEFDVPEDLQSKILGEIGNTGRNNGIIQYLVAAAVAALLVLNVYIMQNELDDSETTASTDHIDQVIDDYSLTNSINTY